VRASFRSSDHGRDLPQVLARQVGRRWKRDGNEHQQKYDQAVPGRIERYADVDWWPVYAATRVEIVNCSFYYGSLAGMCNVRQTF
jgi:hypothetical protein